eukprot:scaffold74727_cov23-Tisochrysis_lutea.AAC.1
MAVYGVYNAQRDKPGDARRVHLAVGAGRHGVGRRLDGDDGRPRGRAPLTTNEKTQEASRFFFHSHQRGKNTRARWAAAVAAAAAAGFRASTRACRRWAPCASTCRSSASCWRCSSHPPSNKHLRG